MRQKIKQTLAKFTFLLLAILIGSTLCFAPTAQAENYEPNQIGFRAGIVDTNFKRIQKDETVHIQVQLTLTQPNTLSVGYIFADKIVVTQSAVVPAARITGITIGVMNASKVDSICFDYKPLANSEIPFVDLGGYKNCGFTVTSNVLRSIDLQKGKTQTLDIYLSPSQRQSLGVGGASDTGSVQKLALIPEIKVFNPDILAVLGGLATGNQFITQLGLNAFDLSLVTLNQTYNLQIFNTKAQVDGQTSNPPPPGVTINTTTASSTIAGNVNTGEGLDWSQGIAFLINQIISTILLFFQELLYTLFFYLITPLIQAVLSIRTYSDVFASVVEPGWNIFRGLCNVLIILGMIGIGLGTVFRLSKYTYKNMLVTLIVAALMVNFSMLIPRAILGVADTVQNQFLPNRIEVIRRIGFEIMVKPNADVALDFSSEKTKVKGEFSTTVRLVIFFMMSVAAFFTFAALAGFLVIRIIALWFLLMTSPIAFVGGVTPFTKPYSKKWWDYFFRYAFFTPIIAIFLNVTAVVLEKTPQVIDKVSGADFKESFSPDITTFIFKAGSNILMIVFLWAAIETAKSFKIEFAGQLTKRAYGALTNPRLAGQYSGLNAAGRGANRLKDKVFTADLAKGNPLQKALFAATHPTSTVKAIQSERAEKRKSEKAEIDAAAASMARSSMFGRGTKAKDNISEADKSGKEKGSEFMGANAAAMKKAMGTNRLDQGTKNEVMGYVSRSAENGQLPEMLQNAKKFGMSKNYSNDAKGLKGFLDELEQRKYISAEEKEKYIQKFTGQAARKRQWQFSNMLDDEGKVRDLSGRDQASLDSIKQMEERQAKEIRKDLAKSANTVQGSSLVHKDDAGNPKLQNGAAEALGKMDAEEIKKLNRLNGDTKDLLRSIDSNPTARAAAIAQLEQFAPGQGQQKWQSIMNEVNRVAETKEQIAERRKREKEEADKNRGVQRIADRFANPRPDDLAAIQKLKEPEKDAIRKLPPDEVIAAIKQKMVDNGDTRPDAVLQTEAQQRYDDVMQNVNTSPYRPPSSASPRQQAMWKAGGERQYNAQQAASASEKQSKVTQKWVERISNQRPAPAQGNQRQQPLKEAELKELGSVDRGEFIEKYKDYRKSIGDPAQDDVLRDRGAQKFDEFYQKSMQSPYNPGRRQNPPGGGGGQPPAGPNGGGQNSPPGGTPPTNPPAGGGPASPSPTNPLPVNPPAGGGGGATPASTAPVTPPVQQPVSGNPPPVQPDTGSISTQSVTPGPVSASAPDELDTNTTPAAADDSATGAAGAAAPSAASSTVAPPSGNVRRQGSVTIGDAPIYDANTRQWKGGNGSGSVAGTPAREQAPSAPTASPVSGGDTPVAAEPPVSTAPPDNAPINSQSTTAPRSSVYPDQSENQIQDADFEEVSSGFSSPTAPRSTYNAPTDDLGIIDADVDEDGVYDATPAGEARSRGKLLGPAPAEVEAVDGENIPARVDEEDEGGALPESTESESMPEYARMASPEYLQDYIERYSSGSIKMPELTNLVSKDKYSKLAGQMADVTRQYGVAIAKAPGQSDALAKEMRNEGAVRILTLYGYKEGDARRMVNQKGGFDTQQRKQVRDALKVSQFLTQNYSEYLG